MKNIAWLDELSLDDIATVGGKNAGLGELHRKLVPLGVRVPSGFACTASVYRAFVAAADLDGHIERELAAYERREQTLAVTGRQIRHAFLEADWPEAMAREIIGAYEELGRREGSKHLHVAVRSSATAEDLPDASFAGQQESFLNIAGASALLDACKRCFASLFTDRAIAYRQAKGFAHRSVALSIGVQTLVRADMGASGVMFTLDTETGFRDVVLLNAAYGLGENVVKGVVNPDEIYVWKPGLDDPRLKPILRKRLGAKERTLQLSDRPGAPTVNVDTPKWQRAHFCMRDDDVLTLARWAVLIERAMGRPMDIEWARDGETGGLYVLQARPETVHARRNPAAESHYTLLEQGRPIVRGRSVGSAIVSGSVCVVRDARDLETFTPGSILVAEMTDPDWVPIMKKARGIITDRGGRTCHAAIVSRELGITAIVGTTDATSLLTSGQVVTMSCAQGEEAVVYEGSLRWKAETADLGAPPTRTKIMLNLAQPGSALATARLPVDGIGLVRIEFIVGSEIGVHPMALLHPDRLDDAERQAIAAKLGTERDGVRYFTETLARGVATIAASQYPKPVIVRMSDFKTNEYARLLGGRVFEPAEENPMIGFRGASRYYHDRYRDGFLLECRAMKMAREELGLTNIALMIPFCRTVSEADRVLEVMAAAGLRRGENGLALYMMCEVPANVILAESFARRFDGFSIGSNDLTQLVLGIDRDSEVLADLFDESDPAVMTAITDVIKRAHAAGITVGLCGQAPSDDPRFAEALVDAGIDSISLSQDAVLEVKRRIAALEARNKGSEKRWQ